MGVELCNAETATCFFRGRLSRFYKPHHLAVRDQENPTTVPPLPLQPKLFSPLVFLNTLLPKSYSWFSYLLAAHIPVHKQAHLPVQWIVRTAKPNIFQDPREEAWKALSDTMSFDNRKFSMNRSTGAPRESTKLNRRFTMSEPSVSGMLLLLLSVRTTLRDHLRKSLPSCHPMPKLYLTCLRNVSLEIGGSNTDHLAPPPFNTHTLPPRNKFQNPSPISQRSRRPQIPCWT